MPFTVTHVAVAVPIAWSSGWRLPFSALAIGTMVPDIAGYYPALFDWESTHSFSGVITHCTPIGVMFYYAYQTFLKQPFFDLLPDAVTARMRPWIARPINITPAAVMAVAFCVAVGAMTHIVWDAFTHYGGWGVDRFPVLREIVYRDITRRPIRWFAVVQHGSSLLLLPMLIGFLIWLRKLPRHEEVVDRARMPKAIAWFSLAVIAAGSAVYFEQFRANNPYDDWIALLTRAVKGGLAYTFALFLIYALGMNLLWWRDRIRPPHLSDDMSSAD